MPRVSSLADADPGSEPLYSLTLHSLVLAAASPGHFKGHCERQREDGAVPLPTKRTVGVKRSAQEMATTDETHGDARAEVQMDSQPAAPSFDYRLTLFPGEPEGVPKTVLCHLYTGVVPDEPEQLIWVSELWQGLTCPRLKQGCDTARPS